VVSNVAVRHEPIRVDDPHRLAELTAPAQHAALLKLCGNVMDLSRLSRSQADLPKTIDRLVARGVRVIGVQDGYDSGRL
jgi:hypothetical protein